MARLSSGVCSISVRRERRSDISAIRQLPRSPTRRVEGAEIEAELGGKRDNLHGAPIPIKATVLRLSNGDYVYEGPMNRGVHNTMGPTAVLACRGRHGNVVEVIVSSRRVQALDTAIFRSQGIEPTERKILAVKSSVHFRGAFTPIASRIILVNTPGYFSWMCRHSRSSTSPARCGRTIRTNRV